MTLSEDGLKGEHELIARFVLSAKGDEMLQLTQPGGGLGA